MLDILIPIHAPNVGIAKLCVEAIDDKTIGIPYRIILAMDGVTRNEYAELEAFMRARKTRPEPNPQGVPGSHQLEGEPAPAKPDWLMIDWPGQVYWHGSIKNCLDHLDAEFLVIMPPWIEVSDARWFGKLQQATQFDPSAMIVTFPPPEAPMNSHPPAKMLPRKMPNVDAMMTRRQAMREVMPKMRPPLPGSPCSPKEWVNEFSRVVEERYGTRWTAPSVRYYVMDHKEHIRCQQQESSAEKAETSVSPSPTTPASPTPTTTDSDGSEVSVPF